MAAEHDAAAASIIRRLTGGRYTWPPVRVREVYPISSHKVRLVGRPVRQVVSVLDRDTGDPLTYDQAGVYLYIDPASSGKQADVTYEYGSPPPGIIDRAVSVLAAELVLAEEDPPKCRLPDRVISMSRQGVTYSFENPSSILDNGRTGIFEIDLALASFDVSKVKRRARVFSPEFPPPMRLSVAITGDATNLMIPQGMPWSNSWAVADPDGNPINDAWAARSQVRVSKESTSQLLHEFTALVSPAGVVTISATDAESAAWVWKSGYYDVEVVSPLGVPMRVAHGVVTVSPEVTA